MSEDVHRRPDGSVITPAAREPACVHPGGQYQPASACRHCKDGEPLAYWKRQWAAYFEENPDDPRNPYPSRAAPG